jgi:hypothetical protein
MAGYGAAGTVPNREHDEGETENLLNNAESAASEQQKLPHSHSYEEESPSGTGSDQTSGEDSSGQRQHQHQHYQTKSWSGVLSNFATDIFGKDNSDHSNRPGAALSKTRTPPRPPARRHTGERDYHLRNQKFLQHAAAQKASRERKPYARCVFAHSSKFCF